VRRPPFGYEAIRAGHDMEREFRILSSLAGVYPLAPKPYFFCAKEVSPIGVPMYAMERVRGAILRAPLPAALANAPDRLRAVSTAIVEALVDLHAVDVVASGLAEIGRPDGYVRRQVTGWTDRYRRARTDTIDDVERVAAWLDANVPEEGPPALIHND